MQLELHSISAANPAVGSGISQINIRAEDGLIHFRARLSSKEPAPLKYLDITSLLQLEGQSLNNHYQGGKY
jgi:hypothetical protein